MNENIIIGQHSTPVKGIELGSNANLSLSQNRIENATFYMDLTSQIQHYTSLNIDLTNVVDGKAIYYLVNRTRLDAGDMTNSSYIFLVNCNDSSIMSPVGQGLVRDIALLYARNNTISSFVVAGEIVLFESTNNTIKANVIRHPQIAGIGGIRDYFSTANIISNNDVLVNFGFGIYSAGSISGVIEQNKVTTTSAYGKGIYLEVCTNLTVRDNILCDNQGPGLSIYSGTNISVTGNDISRNREAGIEMYYTRDSFILNNDITSNLEYGIDLVYSRDNEIAWNRIDSNEGGCIGQDYDSYENDIHDNDCTQSTNWVMIHIIIPAAKICAILGIFVLVLTLVVKYKGRIKKWVNAHSRDVPLALECEALKERVKEKRFIRPRIVEFYSLNSLGLVLSLSFHFFKGSFPADDLATLSILTFFQYSFLAFIALSILGIWGFRKRTTKALLPMRYLSGVLSIWALVYFISYVIWPLYVLRYAYEVAEIGIYSVLYPGCETYLQFPIYGIIWQDQAYYFIFTVTCAHPGIWGAFIGIVLFLPGQSIVSKIKKGCLLFLLDHIIYLVTMVIETIIYIESGLDWYDVHAGPVSGAINIPIAIAWRLIALLVLFPDIKILLKKVFQMAGTRLKKAQPIHPILS
jgi:parallel beta-helix repeat protein